MALEDYFESEVAIAAAATAAVLSPRVRGVLRTGAVYGLAGVLMAGDALGTFARGVARGAQQTASAATATAQQAASAAAATAQKVTQQPRAEAEGEQPRRTRRTREAPAESEGGAS
jgi:membrane protease subunit (stomatin/prohibitin family)